MSFLRFDLSAALQRAVSALGYSEPTPVQEQAIPLVREGRDLVARAQTGTGKTAAFALPLLEKLFPGGAGRPPESRRPRVLVITPTRELAAQVQEAFRAYGAHVPLRSTSVFGGVGMGNQIDALRRGVHVLVATPGRLLDHLDRRNLDLSRVDSLVLDEADRMLDMGFMPAIRRILEALPRERQTLLFSATIPAPIQAIAARFLRNPATVQVAGRDSAAATVTHRVHSVARESKRDLLVRLLGEAPDRQTLVFCRTKHGSDRLCRQLRQSGIHAEAIHGNKSQGARTRALKDFKAGRVTVLVATDIAARGLDIEQLPLVVNFDMPLVAEDYVHRIGRTGRAGAEGTAISLVCHAELNLLREIERLLGRCIEKAPAHGVDAHRVPAPIPHAAPRAAPPAHGARPRREHAPFRGARNGRPQGRRARF